MGSWPCNASSGSGTAYPSARRQSAAKSSVSVSALFSGSRWLATPRKSPCTRPNCAPGSTFCMSPLFSPCYQLLRHASRPTQGEDCAESHGHWCGGRGRNSKQGQGSRKSKGQEARAWPRTSAGAHQAGQAEASTTAPSPKRKRRAQMKDAILEKLKKMRGVQAAKTEDLGEAEAPG